MAASYSWNNDMELSYKDIQGLRVQEDLRENIRVVRITGLVFHSGLAISKITKIIDGNSMVIKIYLTNARPGLSGRIDIEEKISKNIDYIFIENKNNKIWPLR